MSWIESHQSLAGHRKTSRMARRLVTSKVAIIGHLHCLWWWAIDNAPEGRLAGIDVEDIADAAMWEGDSQSFFDALLFAGFLDGEETGYYLHHWHDYAGKLIDRRKKDAFRKKNPPPSDVQNTFENVPAELQRTSNGNIDNSDGKNAKSIGTPAELQRTSEGSRARPTVPTVPTIPTVPRTPLTPQKGEAANAAEQEAPDVSIKLSERIFEPHEANESPKGSNVTLSACARFYERYRAKFDASYQMPKTESLELGRKLWVMGSIEFDKALNAFLSSDDDFVRKRVYAAADFTGQINRWVSEAKNGPLNYGARNGNRNGYNDGSVSIVEDTDDPFYDPERPRMPVPP